jgi:hypothetical protein
MVGSTRSDPRTVASLMAVDRALRWYIAEVPSAKAPPLDGQQARVLREILDGGRRLDAAAFDWMLIFGRAMYRLARLSPEAPDCNVGDVLTALAAVPGTAEDPAWPFDTAVDPEAFIKLEFRAASEGIAEAQRENREGWWAHGQRNRNFIMEGAAKAARKHLAVVLGAGHAYDLPLVDLARTFEQLLLIDIDGQALEATVGGVFKDPALRARVRTRVMDLTGINKSFIGAMDEVLDGPGDADTVQARVEQCCRSYRLAQTPVILPDGPRADLLVSSCVASQVAWPQRTYALKVFEQRFRPVRDAAEQRWARAWAEFELRVQQDHINSLAAAADLVVLTSDMTSQVTAIDAAGVERTTGQKIHTMGVDSLRERIPQLFQVDREASWTWPRYRAVPRGVKGSRMDVEALVLREPQSPSGLWLPPPDLAA